MSGEEVVQLAASRKDGGLSNNVVAMGLKSMAKMTVNAAAFSNEDMRGGLTAPSREQLEDTKMGRGQVFIDAATEGFGP